jgi:hypothetical protein
VAAAAHAAHAVPHDEQRRVWPVPQVMVDYRHGSHPSVSFLGTPSPSASATARSHSYDYFLSPVANGTFHDRTSAGRQTIPHDWHACVWCGFVANSPSRSISPLFF